jgi:hypothetical protein
MLVVALGWSGAAWGTPSDHQTLVYDILRNGGLLGTQRFDVRRGDDEARVEMKTELTYKLLALEVYRFRQTGTELWRAGKLVEMDIDTDDNGKHHHLVVRQGQDGRMTIRTDSQSLAAADPLAAATLWNREALSYPQLIDSIDGTILKVEVDDGGEETLMVGGRAESAHRYKVSGGLRRELWYHRDGRLLRVHFTASDGSQLEYRLTTATPGNPGK